MHDTTNVTTKVVSLLEKRNIKYWYEHLECGYTKQQAEFFGSGIAGSWARAPSCDPINLNKKGTS